MLGGGGKRSKDKTLASNQQKISAYFEVDDDAAISNIPESTT
jgi:hypothetical protein